jgi:1-acyl-sn-glycerol-3-phosphate acyltransferase
MIYFLNAFLRLMIKIALRVYFRKIIIEGKSNIPKNCPIILVANHQNALIDPLLLATHTSLNPHFLTRASVFKNPIAAKFLGWIRMLPIYRVRDGFATIQQNQKTFEQTFEVLRENGTIIIFAEGSHSLIRKLRPLSKGFTRIAFGLKEKYPEKTPVILPVALDYSAHRRSGSRVRITFGLPIQVDMPASQSGQLTKAVETALRKLVVTIPSMDYEEKLESLINHNVDLSSRADVTLFLTEGKVPNPIKPSSGLVNKLMKIFHLPLFLLWIWKSSSIEDKVFDSTFKFLIGFVFAPIWYLLLIVLGLSTSIGSWAVSILLLAWITVWYNKNPQE